LRCVELHHSLRVATGGAELDGASGKSADAAERIVEVAKQQAARDEELMASRVHVGELQEALVEARSLHTALRERCAEQERQAERERLAGGAAGSGKDSGAQLEYLKNIVLKLFTMEDGREALLPVIATFLQFSPAEVKRVRLALEAQRLRPADDGWLFGRLGESWL